MTEPIFTTCLGLACAVGLNVESACAAMRGGIDGFAETGYLDQHGEPIIGAFVQDLPIELPPVARLVQLLAAALNDAIERMPIALARRALPVLLCGSPDGPDLLGMVADRLGISVARDLSRVFSGEHTVVFEALRHARELLGNGRCAACLIVAVDSLVRARSLLALERVQRLKTAENSDGVIPGEAAGVLLLTSKVVTPSPVKVLGLGFGKETATVLNDEPMLAKGMVQAVRGALAEGSVELHDVRFRLSDVAGESYGFRELSLTLSRVLRHRVEELPLWHPADKVGDCGAASGLIQIAVVEQAFAREYAPGSLAICHSSGPSSLRAAALVSGVTERGTRPMNVAELTK